MKKLANTIRKKTVGKDYSSQAGRAMLTSRVEHPVSIVSAEPTINQREKMPCFSGRPEIIRNQDGSTSFQIINQDGGMFMTQHTVFPGISLIYNDVHLPYSCANLGCGQQNILEVDHCRDGYMECRIEGSVFRLAPGDMSIHLLGQGVREEVFPTSHYHGITIQIDLDISPRCLACILEDVDVEPCAIAKKLNLEHNHYFALRQLPTIAHIFSELYTLPHCVQKGYFKVKILELFLFLRGFEPETRQLEQRGFSEVQTALAKNLCRYLMEHIDRRITVQELVEQFNVPESQINSSFQHVYGMTIASYMRGQRMQTAAKLLTQTDRTVLDIAGQLGYENGSKFANAFRTVMGVTPTQYRKKLCHVPQNGNPPHSTG